MLFEGSGTRADYVGCHIISSARELQKGGIPNPEPLEDRYELLEEVGSGAFAVMCVCVCVCVAVRVCVSVC